MIGSPSREDGSLNLTNKWSIGLRQVDRAASVSATEPNECRVDQANPNDKGDPILELERELRGFVPEQQHCQETARPTTDGTYRNQVEFAYPISARTSSPELVPGKQEESHHVRQHQPKQKEIPCRKSTHFGQAGTCLIITFTNRFCHS
jgi:hypothetical protein